MCIVEKRECGDLHVPRVDLKLSAIRATTLRMTSLQADFASCVDVWIEARVSAIGRLCGHLWRTLRVVYGRQWLVQQTGGVLCGKLTTWEYDGELRLRQHVLG